MTKKILISFVCIAVIAVFVSYHFIQRADVLSTYRKFDIKTRALTRQLPSKEGQEVIRILAISGGGIYGILPIHILDYLEQQTGKPTTELFDLMVGTSTGAIVNILLTTPDANNKPRYTANELLYNYISDSQKIFYAPWYHRLLTLNGFLGPKYITSSRYNMFKESAGPFYFDQLLNNVIVPTYEIYKREPLLFYNWDMDGVSSPNFQTADLLMGATSPFAFFPAVVFDSEGKRYALSDGGLYDNNPALGALLTAMHLYPGKRYILVSLGTGKVKGSENPTKVVDWGLLHWILKIISVMYDSSNKFTDLLLTNFFNHPNPVDYYYFDSEINSFRHKLDDISPQNIEKIHVEGRQLVNDCKADLDILAEKLLHPNSAPPAPEVSR